MRYENLKVRRIEDSDLKEGNVIYLLNADGWLNDNDNNFKFIISKSEEGIICRTFFLRDLDKFFNESYDINLDSNTIKKYFSIEERKIRNIPTLELINGKETWVI